ncbi:hypothetical protein [Bacillus sp. MB2021]|uniref:hypothetical protein n=1 Tax=Bacillus sp. MB2021 TaxID=1408303 RepID=UPI0004E1BC41|nr:hypothetical protein [Bacillus sp. MB2021]
MNDIKFYFYDFIPVKFELTEDDREQVLKEFPTPILPTGEEIFNINEFEKGINVKLRLLLNDFNIESTKTNKQYLKIRFSNSTFAE